MLTQRHRFFFVPSRWFPIPVLPFLVILAGCSSSGTIQRASKSMSDTELASMAREIHERVLTIDTHDDISGDFASDKDDESSPDNRRQVTLYKMKKGGLDVEFFAAFTGNGPRTPDAFESAYKRAVSLFDAIHRLPDRYPELVDIAYSPDDVTRIHASGKIVACIGMENGYPIGTDLATVKEFYDRGTRYITLTHSGHNQICDSSTPREGEPKEEHGGLSEFGKQLIREMNRLGKRPASRAAERPLPEHVVEALQHVHPVGQGTMAHLQVLTERIQREQRADSLGKQLCEQLEGLQLTNRLEVTHVFPEEPVEALPLPPAERAGRLRRDRDVVDVLLAVELLHELVHWGDDQDGVDRPGEEGEEFERSMYGEVIG